MTTRTLLMVLGLALVGCAPAQPASCPVSVLTPQYKLEAALARLEATLESLDALGQSAGGLLGVIDIDTAELELQVEAARKKAAELRYEMQQAR